MNEIITGIIIGVAVLIIGSWLGLGGSTKVTIQGGSKVRKTGKKIMIVGVLMIICGAILAGKDTVHAGLSNSGNLLAIYGFIVFVAGKIVAWWQRN